MEPVYDGIGSVMSGGPPRFLSSNWPGAVVSASNPTWPLDYPTLDYATETSFCPRFGSAPDPASLFHSAPPYLMFPNMIYPLPQDFEDMYKPSYESSIHLRQELGSPPILISGLDSHKVATPVFTAGLPDSPSAGRAYGISMESGERNLTPGSQAMEMLQVATSMPSTFSLHSSVDRDYVKEVSNKTAAFTTFGSANLAQSSPESIPVPQGSNNTAAFTTFGSANLVQSSPESIPVPQGSTSSANEADKRTAMSIKERDDPDSSSIQESRAESVVTTATNRKNHSLKRRKSQQKTVVCVPATGGADKPTGECVPTDSWSWRKYGQKPIKGSPYPRGYYRCSSSKGCPARKQVERSRTDPSMLILTYTSDHNHAWSTPRGGHVGTSRRNDQEKRNSDSPALPDNLSSEHDNQPISSIIDSPVFHVDHAVSPTTTTVERSLSFDQESDFDIANSDICQDDDFFAQLDELPDCFVMFRKSPLRERSDDEADISQDVDPFNLFNWSFVCSGHGVDSVW